MGIPSIRRLAAVDMYGARGTLLRRRVIIVEFVLGATVGTAVGFFIATATTALAWRLFGAWMAGMCLNYVPLAGYALSFNRPARLDLELAGVDLHNELRRYTKSQFWIAVPLLFVVLGVVQLADRPVLRKH